MVLVRSAEAIFAFGLIDAVQVRQLKQRDIAVIGTATTVTQGHA